MHPYRHLIQGLQPGPFLFTKNADVVYGLFASLFVGNILMLIIGLLGVRLFCRVVELPKRIIIPVIITLSMVGACSMNNNIFDMSYIRGQRGASPVLAWAAGADCRP